MRDLLRLKAGMAGLAADQRGATAIEYALIAGLISIAAITAMSSMGNTLSDSFSNAEQIMRNGA